MPKRKPRKQKNGRSGLFPSIGANRLLKSARRGGLVLAIIVGVIWVSSWLWFTGAVNHSLSFIHQQFVEGSAKAGLVVDNILVQGRNYVPSKQMLDTVRVYPGDPLITIEPEAIRERVEALSWVKTAIVQIRYPDTLFVKVDERQPLALWYMNGDVAVIDEQGVVLTRDNLAEFRDLIIVSGDSANEKASDILAYLTAEPEIYARLKVAALISNRRWDLKLNNGLIVHLPEADVGLSLSRLAKAHQDSELLEKDIVSVDARHEDRLIIKTKPGAVQTLRSRPETKI